jgi:HK97 gp10 family phage protein
LSIAAGAPVFIPAIFVARVGRVFFFPSHRSSGDRWRPAPRRRRKRPFPHPPSPAVGFAMSVSFRVNDKAFLAKLDADVERKLDKAAEMLRAQVVRNISESAFAEGPSEPGNPPRARTGKLRQSILQRSVGRFERIVGTTLKYGNYLEFGTSRMAARPFLRPALLSMRWKIKGLFSQKG